MATIDHYSFAGRKVLVRVDFNVPIDAQGHVTDNTRITAALPTIRRILADGGAVVLMSHLGRPKGTPNPKYSLQAVCSELSRLLACDVLFAPDCVGSDTQAAVAALPAGGVLLLENLRFYAQEEQGDAAFAQQLAQLGCDTYLNDAFGAAHRAHASTATIAAYFAPEHRLFGYLMTAELDNAQRLLHHVTAPFTAILGGAKVSDKILLIENLLDKAQYIIIGGGMAYTFFKAMGGNIGASLVENDRLNLANQLLEKAQAKGVQILLPPDSVVADRFADDANRQTLDSNAIPDGLMGLDIGERSCEQFEAVISRSKTIFWNGPMGVFEMPNFRNGTQRIAQAVARATQQHGAYSLVGGGDSVAAIQLLDLGKQVSYVSTGGGAMLELLEGKTLPGVAAIG